MKKMFILVLYLFLLTGCEVNYEMEFNDDYVTNELEFEVLNTDYKSYPIPDNSYSTAFEYFNNLDIYKYIDNEKAVMSKDITETKIGIEAKYNDSYTYDKLDTSYLLNTCFENINYKYNEDSVYLELSGEFNCYYGETNIVFKTSKKIMESNHNEKKSNNYIWHITEDNKDNVNIIFSFGNVNNGISVYQIVTIIIVIVLSIGVLVLYKVTKRNDY